MRPWHFAVLWLGLFIAAIASGVELLSYLAYLVLFVGAAMWITARLTLEGLSITEPRPGLRSPRRPDRAELHARERAPPGEALARDHRAVELARAAPWPRALGHGRLDPPLEGRRAGPAPRPVPSRPDRPSVRRSVRSLRDDRTRAGRGARPRVSEDPAAAVLAAARIVPRGQRPHRPAVAPVDLHGHGHP